MSGTFVIILMQMSASMSMKSASQSSPAYLDKPSQFSSWSMTKQHICLASLWQCCC